MDQNVCRLFSPVHLVTAETRCWKCSRTTLVYALQVDDLEDNEDADDDGPMLLEKPTFVYDLEVHRVPAPVVAQLVTLAPNYTQVADADMEIWANVCQHCRFLQGPFYLHSRPDGPFFRGPEEFAGPRTLLSDEGFSVDCVGYHR